MASSLVPGAGPALLAAGDIASCTSKGDEATAALFEALPGTVATLGDHVYEDGTATEFRDCYDLSQGRAKDRTRPMPGNHDYHAPDAAGYFGAAAGDPTKGYYSYDLGAWHVVALNANCDEVSGCPAGSLQERWLRADLAERPARCTLAYWHHPRFSSGTTHGDSTDGQPLWQALYDARAELVLGAHEHNYERFAPQDPTGAADPDRGIRQFVIGTGGNSHYKFGMPAPNSEVRNADTFGVLALMLRADGYDWRFVPVAGKSFAHVDHGTQEEIFVLKKGLLAVRRVVAPQRDVMNVFVRPESPLFGAETVDSFQDVSDHIQRVTDTIDTYRDLLSGCLNAFLAVAANRLDQTVKTLTASAIILTSMTLIAGVYGMNFVHLPELNWRLGYAWALGLMATVGGGLLLTVRRMDWL